MRSNSFAEVICEYWNSNNFIGRTAEFQVSFDIYCMTFQNKKFYKNIYYTIDK